MKGITNSERGFTLIEVMIAVTLLTVGVLAVCHLQVVALKGSSNSKRLTEASLIAQTQAERLLMLDYNDGNLSENESEHDVVDIESYNVSWRVQNDSPFNNVKRVEVFVTWIFMGEPRRVSYGFVKDQ